MVKLRDVSKGWTKEAMDVDYVAEVNEASEGKKHGAKMRLCLTGRGEVEGCDRA